MNVENATSKRIPLAVTTATTQRLLSRLVTKDNDCMEWTGAVTPQNYGRMHLNVNGVSRTIYPHRYMATVRFGPIPDSMDVDHLCRNPLCCNPDHLEVVTHFENAVVRANGRGDPGTHCKRGHERTEYNTYHHPGRKAKECKTCQRIRNLEWRERQKK